MFIQTDIIDDNQLTQNRGPILDVVKFEGDYPELVYKSIKKPKYLNINKTIINSISIKITDQNNEFINFDFSPTLTLHLISSK